MRFVSLVALALLAGGAGEVRAETLAQRFDAHLAALSARGAQGPLTYWHLAEAQRLAPMVEGGLVKLEGVATAIAERGRLPWLQGEALGTLASVVQARSAAEARAHVKAAGVLSAGVILGPLPGPGTANDGAAGLAYDPQARVQGQREQVGWRAFEDAALQGPLQTFDLLDTDGDAHALILHALEVARPVDAVLVVSANGPLGVWVDGKSVVDWDGERGFSDWQHTTPLRLEAGRHHVLVRVGHRSRPPVVMARLSDARGRLPRGVEVVPPRAGATLAGWAPAKRMPKPLPEQGPDKDPAVAGRLMLQFVEETGKNRTAELLEAAIEAAEKAPAEQRAELYYLLGRAEHSDPDARRRAFERAVELSGGAHSEALGQLVRIHAEAGLADKADALQRQLLATDPKNPEARLRTVQRISQLTDPATALATLPRDLIKTTSPELLAALAALHGESGLTLPSAQLWGRVAELAGGSPQPSARAILDARRAGDLKLAERLARDALSRRPYNVQLHLLLARTLAATEGGPGAGLAELNRAKAMHPSSPDVYALEGRLLLLRGDQAAAIRAFDRALALRPQDRDLVEYRRALIEGRSMAMDFAVPVDEVLAGEPPPKAPQGGTVLLHKTAVRVYESGLSSRFEQKILRIDREGAIEQLKSQLFAFTPGEDRVELVEAEVIHADGRRSRPSAVFERSPQGKTSGVYTLTAYRVVRFDQLGVGDIIHLQTRRDEIGDRNIFGRFFGVVLPLADELPRMRVEVVIDAPAGRQLYAEGVRTVAATRSVDEGRQRLTWRVGAVPAIEVEPQMPGYGSVAPYVSVSTYESWRELAAWYRELIRPQLTLSPELEKIARDLADPQPDLRSKVAAIAGWVVRNTRYVGIEFGIHGFKPYRVTQVYSRGYGDCKDKASMLVALLESVGIDAEFVLVRTRDLGDFTRRPATLWAFNHAIAYVPELDAYIDGTSEFAGLGELPRLDQGAFVLRMDLDAADAEPVLTTIPFAPANANLTEGDATISVSREGSARIARTERVTGTAAPRIRMLLAPEARRDQIVASLVGESLPGATLDKVSYEGLEGLGVPVSVTTEISAPQFAVVGAGNATLNVPISVDPDDLLKRWGMLAERTHPLLLFYPYKEVDRASIRLPRGARIERLPPPVALKTPFGSYSLELKRTAEGFDMAETLTIDVAVVSPRDYPAFRRFLGEVVAARSETVSARLP